MPSQTHAERLSTLIGAIYDCALDPGKWPATLAALDTALGCSNAILALQDLPSGNPRLAAAVGVSDETLAVIPGYATEMVEMWGGYESIMAHDPSEPAVLSWLDPPGWAHNRYFAEVWTPKGMIDVVGVVIARDASAMGSIGFSRHVSAGPFTEGEIDLLRLLVPHIQRATTISRILDIATVEARTFMATLDTLASGVILIDANLGIVHSNAAAAAILARRDGIRSEHGTLMLAPRLAQEALRTIVTAADHPEESSGRRGFGIPVRHAAGNRAVLHVLPLSFGSFRSRLHPEAAAAIFVSPPSMPMVASDQAIAALFDLTPVEAKVFGLVASGKTIAETAQRLGIGRATAKTHLLRIFAKTDTNRQVDLVRLGASLSLSA